MSELQTLMNLQHHEIPSDDIVRFVIRYDEKCYNLGLIRNEHLAILLKYKLSHLQCLNLKFLLCNMPKKISCSDDSISKIFNGNLLFENQVKKEEVLTVQSYKNSCAVLTSSYELYRISIFTDERIDGKFIKFVCDKNGNIFAIKTTGLFYSSNDIDVELGLYKDIYLSKNVLCLIRENGDVFIYETFGRLIYKFLGKCVKKAVSDGDFFAFLLENGTIEIYSSFDYMRTLDGIFIDIECSYCYLVAIRIDNTAFFWWNDHCDDSPDISFLLSFEESQNVVSVSCQETFYVLYYENRSIVCKGSKKTKMGNIIDYSTCDSRCVVLDDNYNHLEI